MTTGQRRGEFTLQPLHGDDVYGSQTVSVSISRESPHQSCGVGRAGAVTSILQFRTLTFREFNGFSRVTTLVHDGSGTGTGCFPGDRDL